MPIYLGCFTIKLKKKICIKLEYLVDIFIIFIFNKVIKVFRKNKLLFLLILK